MRIRKFKKILAYLLNNVGLLMRKSYQNIIIIQILFSKFVHISKNMKYFVILIEGCCLYCSLSNLLKMALQWIENFACCTQKTSTELRFFK